MRDYYAQPYDNDNLSPPVTTTVSTMDMQSELDKFRQSYTATLHPLRRKYRRLATIVPYSTPNWNPTIMDMQENGFAIALSESDLRSLLRDATEGMKHARFREMNPAAMELYEQYLTMYFLTQHHEG